MATDSRRLLESLEDYERALTRQATAFRCELGPLHNSWLQLSSVYEGTAAEQFHSGWQRTTHALEDYIDSTERLLPILRERIEALRTADRPDSGGFP